ncbi:hypothetical protein [Vagococcus fluvialis]|uniref:hypothetical protein n=1 Tax=Vagococcus fluvialis TaxID=2738 RepID=UPI001A8F5388|nr:hypothetical protein [Vagococcus fluvialis]MBO0486079.1 hypothetical protein [Vagococcus fluvialis]
MKKILLALSLFVLVGCSNDKKVEIEKPKISEGVVIKSKKLADDFNDNVSDTAKIKFDDSENKFVVFYEKEEHKKAIESISNDLKSPTNYKALEFLATNIQSNTENIFKDLPDTSILLENPSNKKEPLYVITSKDITYPAVKKANDGDVPKEIDKMEGILKTANFMYQPNGNAHFNYTKEQIIVDLKINQDSSSDVQIKEFDDKMKESTIQLYETLNSVYGSEYDIQVNNNDKQIVLVEKGELIE